MYMFELFESRLYMFNCMKHHNITSIIFTFPQNYRVTVDIYFIESRFYFNTWVLKKRMLA